MALLKSKSARAGQGPGRAAIPISSEIQRRMIAEAAYYKAAERNFDGGDPVQDWLAAEVEIQKQGKKKK